MPARCMSLLSPAVLLTVIGAAAALNAARSGDAVKDPEDELCLGRHTGTDCDSCPARGPDERPPGPPPPPQAPAAGTGSVAVFAQVFNHDIWGELRHCIGTVGKARGRRTVDVYLAVVKDNPNITNEIMQWQDAGLVTHASVQVVRNSGADIGQFMQQVQHIQELHKEYDIMLKIHSKTNHAWRVSMLGSLCGSEEQVQSIWQQFEGNNNLGIVGPPAWTWTNTTDYKETLKKNMRTLQELQDQGRLGWEPTMAMQNLMILAWGIIFPCEKGKEFPSPTEFAIIAGSMYWSRGYPLLQNEAFLASVPKFLGIFGEGYHTGCKTDGCQQAYALERVIPTMVVAKYQLQVGTARENRPASGHWVSKWELKKAHFGGPQWGSG